MSRKVLVTGATGYLGGRLVQYLHHHGFEVVAGTRQKLDFSRPDSVAKSSLSGIDSIVHLAASGDKQCRENPELASTINIEGTRALVEAAVRSDVKRFVYISTAHVYGSPLEGELSETREPHPQHLYGSSHLAAEEFVLRAHREGKMLGIVLRLSNVVGAPASASADCWMLLAHDLSRQAVRQGSLALKTPGVQLRDFLPMEDFLRAIAFVLNADRSALGDGLFNLGSGKSVSVRELAQDIRERASSLLGKELPLSIPPITAEDHANPFAYSIQKLIAAGFRPSSSLGAAIDELLRFCREHAS